MSDQVCGPRPTPPPVAPEAISGELKALPRWVAWRYERRPGGAGGPLKWTKVPKDPNRPPKNAKSNDPATWGAFDAAMALYRSAGLDGVGLIMGGGLVGVDIDKCITDGGEVSDFATGIVARFDTYTETSPSGRGLRLIGKGVTDLPRGKGANDRKLGLEVYVAVRFLTITGNAYHGVHLAECAAAVTWLYDTHLPHKMGDAARSAPLPVTPPASLSDAELVALIRRRPKYDRLWQGTLPDGKSHSEADLALVGRIAYFAGNDPARIDRLFRLSSLGQREKWTERADYRSGMIAKALEGKTKFYTPPIRVKMTLNGRPLDEEGPARRALKADPNRTDDEIAGQVGCKPDLVTCVRRKLVETGVVPRVDPTPPPEPDSEAGPFEPLTQDQVVELNRKYGDRLEAAMGGETPYMPSRERRTPPDSPAPDVPTDPTEEPSPDDDTGGLGDGYVVTLSPAPRGVTAVKLTKDAKPVEADQINVGKADQRERLVAEWGGRHPAMNVEGLAAALLGHSFADVDVDDTAAPAGAGPVEADDDPHKLARLALPILEGIVSQSWRTWRGDSYLYRNGEYVKMTRDNATGAVTRAVKQVVDRLADDQFAAWLANGQQGDAPTPVKVGTRLISDVEQAVRAARAIRDDTEAPGWLAARPPCVPAESDVVPCRNGLLVIPRAPDGPGPTLIDHTREYFALGCLPFDFDPDPPPPAEWLKFLDALWPGDQETKDALAEHVGYGLTDDVEIQKHLALIGPPRSGKGVITRVHEQLNGVRRFASSSLTKLGRPFGLHQLVWKCVLALTGTRVARGPEVMIALENLLKITGNDSVSIEQKNRDEYTGRLKLHVILVANELPKFADDSNALAERFVIFETTQSFAGREDTTLDRRLGEELPSILVWALQGLARLRRRGKFIQPRSGADQAQAWREMASPVKAFVEDRCVLGAGFRIGRSELFNAWKGWAEARHHDVGNDSVFGRSLNAAFPGRIKRTQPRHDGPRMNLYAGIALRGEDDAGEQSRPPEDDLGGANWGAPDLGGLK